MDPSGTGSGVSTPRRSIIQPRARRPRSPVHTVNNLALDVWGLLRGAADFSIAIGDTVTAGWGTDCNGATVGALWGLTGRPIPPHWTEPWAGRIETSLAGVGELQLDDLVQRTLAASTTST